MFDKETLFSLTCFDGMCRSPRRNLIFYVRISRATFETNVCDTEYRSGIVAVRSSFKLSKVFSIEECSRVVDQWNSIFHALGVPGPFLLSFNPVIGRFSYGIAQWQG